MESDGGVLRKGSTRSIGISNFNVSDIDAILDTCRIRPMVDQIKFHIGHQQQEIREHCAKNEILVEGYSPLATGNLLITRPLPALRRNTVKASPSSQYAMSFRKVRYRFPKSTHPEYISQNLDIDFEIAEEDMKFLDGLKGTL